MLKRFFGLTKSYSILVFSIDRDSDVQPDEEWTDFVEQIKVVQRETTEDIMASVKELADEQKSQREMILQGKSIILASRDA